MVNQYGDSYKFIDNFVIKDNIKIDVNDVIEYYITENHSKVETYLHFNISNAFLSRIIKHYNIKKPRQLSNVHNKKTCLQKYGDATYNNKAKYKETCLKKYGVDNIFKDTVKIQASYIKKFGVSNPNKIPEVREKIKQTCLERYGVDSFSKTETFIDKCKNTNLKHFGTEWGMQCIEVKNKFNFNDIADKAFETKKKNGTTNTSKPQKILMFNLCNIFGEDDIIQEYKEPRYPFHCDFYIKSLDMFIELNLYFTHGYNSKIKQAPHLFDSHNSDDLQLLEDWKIKAQTSKFYENAIIIWTQKDVLKHQTAINNNLNYICIYTIDELDNFIKELKNKYGNKI